MDLKDKKIDIDKKNIVEDVEFTDEQTKNQMLLKEDDFIQGLLDAVDMIDTETQRIEIVREGRLFFSFRIRPLSEAEYDSIKKKYTKYVRNKQLGIKMPEDTDNVKYGCSLIFNATVKEDQERLWNNRTSWERLKEKGKHIINALDVIEESLKAGEKRMVLEAIDKLSGYNNNNLEEVAKN